MEVAFARRSLAGALDSQVDMDSKDQLLAMIDRLVGGEWTVPEFETHFYFFYLDQVENDAISNDRDADFFDMVHEKLDWTDAAPDVESRREGWIDHAEYRDWVAQELARYRTGDMSGRTAR